MSKTMMGQQYRDNGGTARQHLLSLYLRTSLLAPVILLYSLTDPKPPPLWFLPKHKPFKTVVISLEKRGLMSGPALL